MVDTHRNQAKVYVARRRGFDVGVIAETHFQVGRMFDCDLKRCLEQPGDVTEKISVVSRSEETHIYL